MKYYEDKFNCHKVLENLPGLVKGSLEPVLAGHIHGHLLYCEKCFEAYDKLENEIIESSNIKIPTLPSFNEFINKILKERKNKLSGPIWNILKLEIELKKITEKKIIDLIELSAKNWPCHPHFSPVMTMGSNEDKVEIIQAEVLDNLYNSSGEKILLKIMEDNLPQITPEGNFKAKFISDDMTLENRILSITIKLPEDEKITFAATFKIFDTSTVEASFSEGNFNQPCLIPLNLIDIFIWPEEADILNKTDKEKEQTISTDEKERKYILSNTGVKVFIDFRDNIIVDKNDPLVIEQGNNWKYTKGFVRGLSYLGSENSEDALMWNVFKTLTKKSPSIWFTDLFPVIMDNQEYNNMEFYFWKEFSPPPSRQIKEGNTHVDLTIETPKKIIFIEAKYKSEISLKTTYDSERDQIIRNLDVGSWAAREREKEFYFILLLTKSGSTSIDKFNFYKNNPERIKEKIGSYRDDLKNYSVLTENMYIIYWEDIYKLLHNKEFLEKANLDLMELQEYLKDKINI